MVTKKKTIKKKVNKKFSNSEMWFKKHKKESEWGFVPIKWEGWVALILLIGVNVFAANYFNLNELVFDSWSAFLVVFFLSLVIFILVARRKTLGTKIKNRV